MGIVNSKALRLLSVLMNSPAEFRERTLMIAGSRLSFFGSQKSSYRVMEWASVVAQLNRLLGRGIEAALGEAELSDIESCLRGRMQLLPPDAPFGTFHNGDLALARLCYAVARARQPECVLETGVCYGVTSFFILAALARNRKGNLHSIDLPPLGQDGNRFVGWAIADDTLKSRWHLHRGVSRKILPKLIQQIGPVSLFVHDSLHTYRNMRMEFEVVWPDLAPGGVIISDDIQGNSAFQEFSGRADVAFHTAIREFQKDSLLGVLVKTT